MFTRIISIIVGVVLAVLGLVAEPAMANVYSVNGSNGVTCANPFSQVLCQMSGAYTGPMSISGMLSANGGLTTPSIQVNPTGSAALSIDAFSTTNTGSNSMPVWFNRALPGGSPSSTTYNGIAFRGIVAQDMGIYTKADDDSLYIGHWAGSGAWQDSAKYDTSGNTTHYGALIVSPSAIGYTPTAGDIIAARGPSSGCFWAGSSASSNGAFCMGLDNLWSWSNETVSAWIMSLTNAGALSTASTITAGGGIYGPALSITGGAQGVGANVNINGDLTVERGGPSGVVYYGNQGAYLYYDGTNWMLNSSNGADTFSLPGVYRETFGQGSAHTYGAVTIRGEKSGWSGINFEDASGNDLGTLMFETDATGPGYWGIYNRSDNGWLLQIDGSGNLTATGGVYGNSRLALKKDVHPLTDDFDPLAVIEKTEWVGFQYKTDKKGADRRYGFIADWTDSHLSGKKHDHFDYMTVISVTAAATKELAGRVNLIQIQVWVLEIVVLGLIGYIIKTRRSA